MIKLTVLLFLGLYVSGCTTGHLAPPFEEPLSINRVVEGSSPIAIDLSVRFADKRKPKESPAVEIFLNEKISSGLHSAGYALSSASPIKVHLAIPNYGILYSGSFCTSYVNIDTTLVKGTREAETTIRDHTQWGPCYGGMGFEKNSRTTLNKVTQQLAEWIKENAD